MTQDALYTSPSGKEASFAWETVKRKTKLKTGVFEFPGRDGVHVQHQGAGERSFPLVCIFSGDDCMDRADQFESMLIERGAGELQHPVYGTVKVVPTGEIEREDDPVTRYGESKVTVIFVETIEKEGESKLNEVAAQAVSEKLDEYNEAAAADFASAIITNDITTQADITTALQNQTQKIIDNLQTFAMADKKNYPEWLASSNELKYDTKNLFSLGADTPLTKENVITNALNIGRITQRLMEIPATSDASIAEKIKGFSDLITSLLNQYKNTPFGTGKIKASYAAATLVLGGACASISSGIALTLTKTAVKTTSGGNKSGGRNSTGGNGTGGRSGAGGANTQATNKTAGTASRAEAVEVAAQVAAFLEAVTSFQDTKISQNAFVDAAPSAHIALTELVYSSANLILNASFSLPTQKTITLNRERQVVELCAELYGTTDYLDDFIIENNLNIDEIEILPMGKKVSYYVKGA